MHRATLAAFLLLLVPVTAQKTALDAVARQIGALEAKLQKIEGAPARVHFLLSRARDSRAPVTTAVEILLAKEKGAEAAMAKAVKVKSSRRRRTALAALVRRGGDAFSFALRQAVHDRDASIGRHLVALVQKLGRAELAVLVLVKGLSEGPFAKRRRTAADIGHIGHRGGIGPLAKAKKQADKRSVCHCVKSRRPRAQVAFITSTSYVRDFHVEVA
jgi:hypothetical protein